MLNSKQRAYLRGLANTITSTIYIGKENITQNIISQADDALTARELIKVKLQKGAELTVTEACAHLCTMCNAQPVQCIGNVFVIYRQSKDKPKIQLP